ncbi:MAG: hypothetical protein WEA77_05810 [Hyphomonas sp.]|uniref:hypothetical protein n=1 Tax=Hyphomonas sp. TaxID=87 RepID=UPI0034A06513
MYGPQLVEADYESDLLVMIGAVYTVNAADQAFASWSKSYALARGADDIFPAAESFTPPPPAAEK